MNAPLLADHNVLEISVAAFDDAILSVYRSTYQVFALRSSDPTFEKYVVPPSTKPKPGFVIFYNPPTFQPPLLIVGQNPANFAPGDSLEAFPNKEMLSGQPPTVNSYIDHDHLFARALRTGFAGHKALLTEARGMNLWFFQSSSEAAKAPLELRQFCSERAKELVEIVRPKNILCLSSHAFACLARSAPTFPVAGAVKACYAEVDKTLIWYSYHPTASRLATREIGVADLPIVAADIESKV